jgi:hypothetical protein
MHPEYSAAESSVTCVGKPGHCRPFEHVPPIGLLRHYRAFTGPEPLPFARALGSTQRQVLSPLRLCSTRFAGT